MRVKLFWRLIRRRYSFVINDLRIQKDYKYNVDGPYVTLKHQTIKEYKKFIKTLSFDSQGIPIKQYVGPNKIVQIGYNPVVIAQYGLLEYGYYTKTQNDTHLKAFINIANWFCDNQDEDTGCWYENFDYFNNSSSSWLKKPWLCGMGQGQALSLLARAYLVTNDRKYLTFAEKGLTPFEKTTNNGGVIDFFFDIPVFEEYPTNPKTHVLNGFIFSVFGLYDLYEASKNEAALALFKNGFSSIKKIIPFYDDSSCSSYDLSHIESAPRSRNANWKYHIIHVSLLYSLYSITNDDLIKTYADKWSKQ